MEGEAEEEGKKESRGRADGWLLGRSRGGLEIGVLAVRSP